MIMRSDLQRQRRGHRYTKCRPGGGACARGWGGGGGGGVEVAGACGEVQVATIRAEFGHA